MSSAINLDSRPKVNRPEVALLPLARADEPAHIIASDGEAIEVAHRLAAEFARDAVRRDREGLLPIAELDLFSQSGLWSITIPREYGGPGLSFATLIEVIKIISGADPSLGQIPLNHFAIIQNIAWDGSEAQKRLFFGKVLKGLRFGNADSERHGANVGVIETKITTRDDHVLVNGRKFYATGALFAHIIWIVGIDDSGKTQFAFVERDAPGLIVINDWSSFGQRGTASGTVIAENVSVPLTWIIPAHSAFDRPTVAGPYSQVMHASIDTAIAGAAVEDTIQFIRAKARNWLDSGNGRASEDQFTISAIGDLEIRLHAAEALLERAARRVEEALAVPNEETVAAAAVAAAEAKVLSSEIAIAATNKLFELGGARSTLAENGLDRHWRNARTYTLHDPVRWKPFHIGNYYLNGVKPPRHPWL